MTIIYLIILWVIGVWLFDKTCLWLERKGWLYYRLKKPATGIIGAGLQELNAQLVPSNRHVIVAQKEDVQSQKSLPDSPY